MRVGPEALAGGPGGLLDLRELALLVVLRVPPQRTACPDCYPATLNSAVRTFTTGNRDVCQHSGR